MALLLQPELDPDPTEIGVFCDYCGYVASYDLLWLERHAGERVGCPHCAQIAALPHI